MLPDFANAIVEARVAGRRPAAMVIVSDGDHGLHRRFPNNPVVRIRREQRPSTLSFRFLAGLDVEIATTDAGRRAACIARAVTAARPEYLRVWHMPSGRMVRIIFCGVTSVHEESSWVCEMEPLRIGDPVAQVSGPQSLAMPTGFLEWMRKAAA